jgi:hypothetical protein
MTKAKGELKKQENTVPEKSISAIEELRVKHKINLSVFAGVKALKSWGEGKQVTEKEFLEAIKNFLQRPINKKGVK